MLSNSRAQIRFSPWAQWLGFESRPPYGAGRTAFRRSRPTLRRSNVLIYCLLTEDFVPRPRQTALRPPPPA